ncbi:UPF0149 family protein [Sphingomonas sp. PP-CE-1G-424]|uniref:UPF0149 family protein n=1 Tax=Sphingomonas sp. PP-CE-1G-424 TaxID=2135658 RepID=UPI0010563243|nr:UPF0149 family protein [Sphingomonas sp. PP-CE-1G-424]TCP66614.1 uncharacterized protein C8J43_10468 [Sphingomonas sp. PP-CE-1G-424]
MKRFPSRFRRLDGALADLAVEEPMLLTELDGFLTGLLICPEAIPPGEWMTVVWGADVDGVAPFEDPLDVQWFADAVAARREEIARDLVRGKLQPIFDVDERDGEVLWEYWIDGFAEAIALRPNAWEAMAGDPESAAPWSQLTTLIAVAREESELDSVEINALQDGAASALTDAVQLLYVVRTRLAGTTSLDALATTASKVGRNDPCPCGSGKKHKRCCG